MELSPQITGYWVLLCTLRAVWDTISQAIHLLPALALIVALQEHGAMKRLLAQVNIITSYTIYHSDTDSLFDKF